MMKPEELRQAALAERNAVEEFLVSRFGSLEAAHIYVDQRIEGDGLENIQERGRQMACQRMLAALRTLEAVAGRTVTNPEMVLETTKKDIESLKERLSQ